MNISLKTDKENMKSSDHHDQSLILGKTKYKRIRLRGKDLFFNIKFINLSSTQYNDMCVFCSVLKFK